MKKIIYFALMFSAVTLMSTSLTSCGDDEPEDSNDFKPTPTQSSIYGTWEYSDIESDGYNNWTFIFKEDNTFTALNKQSSGSETYESNITGTFSLTKKFIALKIKTSDDEYFPVGDTLDWPYTLDGDLLTLDKITLVRKGSNGNSDITSLNPKLIGTWTYSNSWEDGEKVTINLTFNNDGTYEMIEKYYYNNILDETLYEKGNWTSTDSTLILTISESNDRDNPAGKIIRTSYTVDNNYLNALWLTFKKQN